MATPQPSIAIIKSSVSGFRLRHSCIELTPVPRPRILILSSCIHRTSLLRPVAVGPTIPFADNTPTILHDHRVPEVRRALTSTIGRRRVVVRKCFHCRLNDDRAIRRRFTTTMIRLKVDRQSPWQLQSTERQLTVVTLLPSPLTVAIAAVTLATGTTKRASCFLPSATNRNKQPVTSPVCTRRVITTRITVVRVVTSRRSEYTPHQAR